MSADIRVGGEATARSPAESVARIGRSGDERMVACWTMQLAILELAGLIWVWVVASWSSLGIVFTASDAKLASNWK